MQSNKPFYVGVIGGRACTPVEAEWARQTGRLIAQEGWILVCGGMGGIMENACAGAWQQGGVTLGILPGDSRAAGNPFLSYSIATGLGEMRNSLVVRSSQALVAIGGSYGTLSEIAFAHMYNVPVVGLKTWVVPDREQPEQKFLVHAVEEPAEAIAYIKKHNLYITHNT